METVRGFSSVLNRGNNLASLKALENHWLVLGSTILRAQTGTTVVCLDQSFFKKNTMLLVHSPDGGNRTRFHLCYRKGLGEASSKLHR